MLVRHRSTVLLNQIINKADTPPEENVPSEAELKKQLQLQSKSACDSDSKGDANDKRGMKVGQNVSSKDDYFASVADMDNDRDAGGEIKR